MHTRVAADILMETITREVAMKSILLCTLALIPSDDETFDVVVCGGTSAGIAAAVQTSRMGKSVILIEPTEHVGGMTTSGLGWTDSGNKTAIGGISREFYQRVKKHYDDATAWTHVSRGKYSRYRPEDDAMWTFEPKVAEAIYDSMLAEHKVRVLKGERLNRSTELSSPLQSITLESGYVVRGRMFIDATYEGDLMAAAGVSFTVRREANGKYGENLNGVQTARNTHNHRFVKKVDPFVVPGDKSSGLVWGVSKAPLPADGSGDAGLQAYCYRMCMSNVAANRVPFPKPDGYDEKQYELLFRNFDAGDLRFPMKPDMMPNGKTDTNNNGAFSTDAIGLNHAYPEASYAQRERILAAHERYQKGLMWTLANHPRVPKRVRQKMSQWGLAKDEFVDNGNWPYQIYVREARRMVSDYVTTELDCRRVRVAKDSVGLGSYNMDSHNVWRYVTEGGFVQNEGDVQESPGGAYVISYRSIVPKRGEAANLLVPVCLSSSHIAYGSIRMEPVFMILGQSAATAAVMAINQNIAVQDVNYDELRRRLLADKQVLDLPSNAAPKIVRASKNLPGVVLDDSVAQFTGTWTRSTSTPRYFDAGYHHDGNVEHGQKTATFRTRLSRGKYRVRFSYPPHRNRATNTLVTMRFAGQERQHRINQRVNTVLNNGFVALGSIALPQDGDVSVTVSNEGADGYVVVDIVQFLPQRKQ